MHPPLPLPSADSGGGDSSTSCATVCACAGCRRSREGSSTHTSDISSSMTDNNYQKSRCTTAPAALAPVHLSGCPEAITEGRPATRLAACSSADADQRRNLNYYDCSGRTSSRTRRGKHRGGIATGAMRPSLIMLAVLLSSLAVLPPTSAAAEAEAGAAQEANENNPSRKRPRHRNTGAMVTGDISQIISLRLHPHPEPTSEPTFAPTAEPTFAPTLVDDDDDELYGNGMPQPRNERPWEELQNSNSTDADQNQMDGRDAENEDGDSDDNELEPESDDGGTLDLLEKVDNDDDDVETKGTTDGGGSEIIDVSPGEYAVPFTPAPAAMPVVPPTTASPTAAPVTASPTKKPTLAPTKQPTLAPTTAKPTPVPSPNPTTAAPITAAPTRQPQAAPTTNYPTATPTQMPTVPPTTSTPTLRPSTAKPTLPPVPEPTATPTTRPTPRPTASPTPAPTLPIQEFLIELEFVFDDMPKLEDSSIILWEEVTAEQIYDHMYWTSSEIGMEEFLGMGVNTRIRRQIQGVPDTGGPNRQPSSSNVNGGPSGLTATDRANSDCIQCTNIPTTFMIDTDETCASYSYAFERRCGTELGWWGKDGNPEFCQYSCWKNGVPYASQGNAPCCNRDDSDDKVRRDLQSSGGDNDQAPTPLTIIAVNVIKFRSSREYTQERIEDTVGKAFNSESDREKYIQELKATNDRSFRNVNAIMVIMDGSPVPEAPTPAPVAGPGDVDGNSGGGINIWFIVGPLIGGVLVVVAFGILIYSRQQNKRKKAFMSKAYDATRVSKFVDVNQSDDVSTLGDPFPNGGAMFAASPLVKDTADNSVSVMSADYDYARAFGTRGDAPTASTPKSFEADRSQGSGSGRATLSTATGGFAARMDASLFQDDASFEQQYCEQEERIEVDAPAGKLGVVIDTPVGGVPLVHAIKDTSVLADKVRVGDQLVSMDDIDTTQLSAIEVSKLISSRANNPSRVLVFIRLRVGD